MARLWGLMPGMSLDLTTVDQDDGRPWDFTDQEKRDKAEKLVSEGRFMLLIGSPMCSAFSQLQTLNYGRLPEQQVKELKRQGKMHLDFCAKLYRIQMEQGL